MRIAKTAFLLCVVLAADCVRGEVVSLPGKISVPEGWVHTKLQGIDSNVGKIVRKRDELTISYDIGMLAGLHVKPEAKNKYAWYMEQEVRGHPARLALSKPESGAQVLTITFVDGTANFRAKVASMEDVAEVIAIVLSFDYAVPAGKEGKMRSGVTDP